MIIDHIAYRVKDRLATAEFFRGALGYNIQAEFEIKFDNGTKAQCIALENTFHKTEPELFVSDGEPGSVVGDWVAARNDIGGVHHIAYRVDSVAGTMKKWLDKGYAEFLTDHPLTCPGLTQVFTKPSELTGVIFEFIERKGRHGFCKENVKELMDSTEINNTG